MDKIAGHAEVLPYDPAMLEFCRATPKCELHAHLNGSVRKETLR